jgi:hypothetical protein
MPTIADFSNMDFLDSFTDTEPTTSRVNLSNQAIHSVNLTNLTLNGAKVFDNPADKTRFMSEFGQLQIQHPNWSPIRLIRERLQIQMKIHDENSMERRRQKKKATTNNSRFPLTLPFIKIDFQLRKQSVIKKTNRTVNKKMKRSQSSIHSMID